MVYRYTWLGYMSQGTTSPPMLKTHTFTNPLTPSGKGHLCTSRLTFAHSLAWGLVHSFVFIWQSNLGQRASVWHQTASLQAGWHFLPMETIQRSYSMCSNATRTPQSHKSLSLAGWGRWKSRNWFGSFSLSTWFYTTTYLSLRGINIWKHQQSLVWGSS